MTELGILLLVVGGSLFVFGIFRILNNKHVSAKNFSVAVGRDNNAPITISRDNQTADSSDNVFWKIWAFITGIATLIGFAIQMWGPK